MSDDLKVVLDSYYEDWFGISAFYEAWAKKRGMTSNGLLIYYMIHEYPSRCTQRLICEKLLLPKQTVNTILDAIEKKGHIYKKTMESDRRNKYILLTESGQQFADRLLEELYQFEKRALLQMEPAQRTALVESNHLFLKHLTQNLEEE